MAGRIPQTFIDDLLNRVDIVDIIENEIPLKKTGKDFQALCPFHGEKTPSFTVSQEKQFYHCFGCGAHGSALGFLMNHRGLSFVEAVEEAARGAGLEVPREAGEPAVVRADYSPLYEVLERAQAFFYDQLKTHPDRDRAVNYLKARGLSGRIAKRFGIGFAPDAWDALLGNLGTDDEARENLVKSGLVVENDKNRRYDRFRDRITFPVYDRRGRVVAFGGRVIDKGEPKYLNSPETPVFHKRRELYGLYEVRRANAKVDRILVVEGYMDVVALAQFEVNNAVATLGTATTTEQLDLLFKTAPEIVFCFDGDAAGRRAAWRALETALPMIRDGRQAGFMFLPEGHDPDSLIRAQGPEVFGKNASIKPLSEFLLDELATRTSLNSIDGRARFSDLARPMLNKIPPGSFRQLLLQRIAEITQLDLTELKNSFKGDGKPRPAAPRRAPRRGRLPLVEQALKRLLFFPAFAALVPDSTPIGRLQQDNAALLAEILEFIKQRPDVTTGTLLEHYRGTDNETTISELLATPLELDQDAHATEFREAVDSLLKLSQPSAFERAQAEMQRRAGDTE